MMRRLFSTPSNLNLKYDAFEILIKYVKVEDIKNTPSTIIKHSGDLNFKNINEFINQDIELTANKCKMDVISILNDLEHFKYEFLLNKLDGIILYHGNNNVLFIKNEIEMKTHYAMIEINEYKRLLTGMKIKRQSNWYNKYVLICLSLGFFMGMKKIYDYNK